MSGENASRRSGRRRRRRPRRSHKQDNQQSVSSEAAVVRHKTTSFAHDNDPLPDVFIYTYTIYKSDN